MSGAPQIRVPALAALIAQLRDTQFLPPAEIEARQLQCLVRLAAHCATHSPNFAARLKRANLTPGDLAHRAGLSQLAVLTRRALQTAADLYCDQIPAGHGPVNETKTSGSTGEPVVVRRTGATNLMWLALTMREHLWWRRDFSKRMCAIRANVAAYTHLEDWGPPASLLCTTGPASHHQQSIGP